MSKDYEHTEEAIEKMIAYIKTIDPDNATPEMAIKMLENEYAKSHLLSHEQPEVLEAIYNDMKSKGDITP